jgi:hypothetical protein
MQAHGIALWRWLTLHRYQLGVAVALVALAAALAMVGPLLLLIGAFEWKRGRRRVLGLALAGLVFRALVWLWQELWGIPRGRWHACAQCGHPIEERSRAWYCSPICRHYARLERNARAFDPRVARRALDRLERLSKPSTDAGMVEEIPF